MDSIVDALMSQMTTKENLSTIANSVGGNEQGVQSALALGLPLLLRSMSNSASTPGGADTLTNMLSQAGTNNPLDDLGSHLANPEAAGGSNMLGTLFGGQMGGIHNAVSQKSGLSPEAVSKVMAIAAPMVMGYFSKMNAGKSIDANGLSSLLGEQSKSALQSSPGAASLANQFLTSQNKSGLLDSLLGS